MQLSTNIRQENMLGNYKASSRRRNLGNPLIADGIQGAISYNRQVYDSAGERTNSVQNLGKRSAVGTSV